MLVAAVLAMTVTVVTVLVWRHAWAPAAAALLGVTIVVASGAAEPADLELAARELWQPMLVIVSIMATAACAGELGVFGHLAEWIEPRTRGPVRHAFRLVFVLSALCAAFLSNDAAILMFTPVVIELLHHVYPHRFGKFAVPFAFAVFVAAGVAPLPTGNPMNLVVAVRAGISFHDYALHMIPVAIAGWIAAYLALAWCFRAELADEDPAPGEAPPKVLPLDRPARVVLIATAVSIAAYPILAGIGWPLWRVAVPTALVCIVAASRRGVSVAAVARGISWELVPFVFGVFVLAGALARAGAISALVDLYASTPLPLSTVGGVAAVGSAVINNHPMALIHSVALAGAPDPLVYAALVGGDLGPRLLPIGSLAGLLWLHALRLRGVTIPLRTFVRVGVIVTVPSLLVSLLALWLVAAL